MEPFIIVQIQHQYLKIVDVSSLLSLFRKYSCFGDPIEYFETPTTNTVCEMQEHPIIEETKDIYVFSTHLNTSHSRRGSSKSFMTHPELLRVFIHQLRK